MRLAASRSPFSVAWPVLVVLAALLLPPATASWAASVTPVSPGDPAREFKLPDTDGNNVLLSSYKGKVIFLSFWDCFADVCFTTVGAMEAVAARYAEGEVVLLTVCYEIPPALAADGYQKLESVCSGKQRLLIDRNRFVTRLYGVTQPPTSFIIDRDLVVRLRVEGARELREEGFLQQVDQIVKGTPEVPQQ